MIVQCPYCEMYYDDAYRYTQCPHQTFAANDGKNNFSHNTSAYLSDKAPNE